MVKYGKYINSQMKTEYKKYYIDYNLLKQVIKEIIKQQKIEKTFVSDDYSNTNNAVTTNSKHHENNTNNHSPYDNKKNISDVYNKHSKGNNIKINNTKKFYNNKNNSYSNNFTYYDQLSIDTEVDPLERIFKTNKGKYIKRFLDTLDSQINKFYSFFTILEKNIIYKLTKELYNQENFLNELNNNAYIDSGNMSAANNNNLLFLDIFISKIKSLSSIAEETIELCNFLNLNVTAIRKILKKFDKQFSDKDAPVAVYFLESKLKSSNSTLLSVLKFKIIDESSAILDNLTKKIETLFCESISKIKSKNINDMLSKLLLKEIDFENIVMDKLNKEKIIKLFKNNFFWDLKKKIIDIDETNKPLRTNVDIWSIMARENIKTINDLHIRGKTGVYDYFQHEKIFENITRNSHNNYFKRNHYLFNNNANCQLEEFNNTSTTINVENNNNNNNSNINYINNVNNNSNNNCNNIVSNLNNNGNNYLSNVNSTNINNNSVFSSFWNKNNINIWFLILHTLLYNVNQYIILPTNFMMLKTWLLLTPIYSGIIFASAPLASVFFQFFYDKLQFSTKLSILVSCICFLFGNFLYVYSYNIRSIIIMIISRFFIGFGGARSVVRKYLLEHLPNERLSFYSFYYVCFSYLGISLGPALSLLSIYALNTSNNYDNEKSYSNLYDNQEAYYDYDQLSNLRNNQFYYFSMNLYTYPAYVPFGIWTLYLIMFLITFNENVGIKIKSTVEADNRLNESNVNNNYNLIANNANSNLYYNNINTIEICRKKSIDNEEISHVINKEVHSIIKKEKENFSSISIAYFTLVSIFLLNRVMIESLLIYSPIYLYNYYNFNIIKTCLFLIITSSLIIPVSIIINKLLLYFEERKMIILLLLVLFLACLSFSFNFLYQYYLFFIVYSFNMIMTNILETYVSFLYSQIISSNISSYSGYIIVLCTTGGKVLGSLLVCLFVYLAQYKNFELEFRFYSIIVLVVLLFVYKNYEYLRIKAISRIMKKKEYFN